MKINEVIRKDVAVLTVTGNLISLPDVTPFHDYVKKLIMDGVNKIVVDFSKVRWFGSAMLGVMIASLKTVQNAGGDIRLTGITKRIEHIIMVTRLASLFRTLDTVDRAVTSFTTQPPQPAPVEAG